MPFGLWVVVGWMAFVFLFGLVLLGWALESGQFEGLQENAVWVLEEHEPEPWPGREGRGA